MERFVNKLASALFLSFIGIRPFISGMAYPVLDLGLSLGLVIVCLFLLKDRIGELRKAPAAFPIGLFLMALLVSLSNSRDFETSLAQFYKYSTFFLVFFVASGPQTDLRRTIVRTLLVSCGLVSLYALQFLLVGLEYTTEYARQLRPSDLDFVLEYLSRGRAFVPFATPNALAGYLILLVPIGAALLRENNKIPSAGFTSALKNAAAVAVFSLSVLVLLSTQSLGAVLSLSAAVVLSILVQKKNISKGPIVLLAFFFVAAVALLFFLRDSSAHLFNRPLFSLTNRLSYWQQALSNIREHPLVGFGPGNYPFSGSIAAHNSYLQVWAETGILGLAALLWLAGRSLKVDFRLIPESERSLVRGLWIGNLAFLLHNLIDFTFFIPEVALSWWVVLGLLVRCEGKNQR